jgi:protein-L-isoaspartate(D-aspartate) O-methyltransferase
MTPELLQELREAGVLTSDWVPAFTAAPRWEFLPDTLWEWRGDQWHPVTQARHPEQWRRLATGPDSVVTQVDDGLGQGVVGATATSSSSMPRMVAVMLRHLDVHGGERALEIGTGTGWNAALLASRLGQDRVITVECDPTVAAHARRALSAAGFGELRVIEGNGSDGYSPEAPYHRVICTAACHTVPYAWVEQTRPGGRIVTPWGTEFLNWGLLALDVHDDRTATGGIVDTASFMWLRDQRFPSRPVRPTDAEDAAADTTRTWLKPADVVSTRSGAVLAIGTRVPGCRARYVPPAEDADGEAMLYLSDQRTGSWARLPAEPGSPGPYTVAQFGERRLFDEVEAAYQWWTEQGCPGVADWRFTVTPQAQSIELR